MYKVRVLCGAAILAACLAPAAHADEWTKLTYFTFSAPVEMPGMVLPAGSYKFELADPDATRRVVRISEKEGGKIQGIFLSIPDQKLEPSDKPIVMFKETPAGAPEAVKAWFYPGETTGYEFVYPHDQALKIAKATHASVLTAKGEVTGTTLATDTTRVDENDRVLSADEQLKDSGKQAATTSTTTSTTTASTTTASTTTAAAAAPVTPRPPETKRRHDHDHCAATRASAGPGADADPRAAGADDGAGRSTTGDGGPPASDDTARNDHYRTDAGRHIRPD